MTITIPPEVFFCVGGVVLLVSIVISSIITNENATSDPEMLRNIFVVALSFIVPVALIAAGVYLKMKGAK